MTYEEVVAYIESIPGFTSKTSLDHTRRLLDLLGHPEEGMKIIHVAGTNGKGSVCAYLNAMFVHGGFRTGMFTSPHLISIRERFLINGKEVSEELFVRAFEKAMKAVRKVMDDGDVHPAYFELLFLMGLLIFSEEKVDVLILETGMGGTKDVTNVVEHPLACVITSISPDHEQYLGHTIPEIAAHKAGIIKEGIPVICDGHDPCPVEVIRARAAEMNSPCLILDSDRVEISKITKAGMDFVLRQEMHPVRLHISQTAACQAMNASLAYCAMQVTKDVHHIPEEKLAEGIALMQWPCRMETVLPDVIIDGAHNVDGIAEFIRTVEHFHRDQEITILFGSVADKKYPEIIRLLAEGIRPDRVVVTKIAGTREVSEASFAELFRKNGVEEVYAAPEPGEAFDLARKLQGSGMLFCVGSLYLAGELKQYINEKQYVNETENGKGRSERR
uniref:bifunctional folylpolyglutamate synthase/dihydrofolate synthase n=1 Tax=Eubacterium cellulosolvens TaxID=29322 RepID=UPI001FA74658|nr:folylpolyglutamate synthase/dihydrofolate synthase family protein [[Eubacterium] cellulosolvens]